jgi:hypothetical protein
MAAPKEPACNGLKYADEEESREKRDRSGKTVPLEGAASVGRKAKNERDTAAAGEIPDCHEAGRAKAHGQDPREDRCHSKRDWNTHIDAPNHGHVVARSPTASGLATANGLELGCPAEAGNSLETSGQVGGQDKNHRRPTPPGQLQRVVRRQILLQWHSVHST